MALSPSPASPHDEPLESRIDVRLPARELEELRQVARAQDRSAAAEVRRALRAHLAREHREGS
jgi:hypothetical protein